ncbi:LysE family translocator [Okeania sp. SIO2B3]|uniref:LysE family translocator n=1 Tax=Okeania sp. SIO2B3 TaxID=2607784 RepID=UPI0013BEE709|nr:LysE family translocator [Okeania sp. SIO2B3]NET45286.1 LysE family translocator [Okeania sp. SIO2B3]
MNEFFNGISIQGIFGLVIGILVLASTPGPGILAATSCALASGFRSSLLVIGGIVLGDIIFLFIAIFGLTLVTEFIDNAFIIIRVLGGIYLAWLGWKLWTSAPINLENDDEASKKTYLKNFTAGLAITLSNPKVIIFYGAFLPVFVNFNDLQVNSIVLIATLMIVIVSLVTGFYTYLASRARLLFKSEKAMTNINRIAGTVMFGVALLVILIG